MDNPQPLGQPAPSDKSPRTPRHLFLIIGILAAAAVFIAGAVLITALYLKPTNTISALTKTSLEKAKDKCAPDSRDISLGDNGNSLTVRRVAAQERPGDATLDQLDCVLDSLETTDAVREKISRTRALDGMQDASWGDFSASWTYHPDNGINLTIEIS